MATAVMTAATVMIVKTAVNIAVATAITRIAATIISVAETAELAAPLSVQLQAACWVTK